MMALSEIMSTGLRKLGLACIIATLAAASAHAGDETTLLAPTGKLRVGVYPGSPTSLVTDPATHQTHGLSHDLGEAFAKRLGVPVAYVTFQRIADVIAAIKNAEVDFTITNATPARANDVSFSPILVAVELGYLVPPNSTIMSADEIDQPGIRIGVTKGGTSERTLGAKFPNAKIVPAESVTSAVAMFGLGEIDLYATNKPTLFEMSDALPGARILNGSWGLEHMAVAIPKGREQALPSVADFVKDVQSNGLLTRAQQEAGLRGAVKADQ
ncbi:transporter substrate-binding domain-containing protein [Bradyrhizobium sp. LTSPM299]|uniref:transporter substrate-binding domain-containing protein n=1 Tax=Bradyrhizobium sp. LTSPM299 TaxID=1619233 RepID=UPI000ABD9C0A|nr:transporter substrate-binding domain-containing protein [Bradyrhizobium sp. LTSPM299]